MKREFHVPPPRYLVFRSLAEKFVAAHHATARLWQLAPPSPKQTLHPCPLSLMEPDCTCDEIGPFRGAQRSRRESTSRRMVELKGCAAGWAFRMLTTIPLEMPAAAGGNAELEREQKTAHHLISRSSSSAQHTVKGPEAIWATQANSKVAASARGFTEPPNLD